MGTWIVHLRIADYFINTIDGLDLCKFSAGSVAPDCGWGKKDSFGEFTPPPSVTHWTNTGKKINCRYKDFYDSYLAGCADNQSFSFYLGYYIHLLTDVLWSSQVYYPEHLKFIHQFNSESEFISAIKKDWNDLDLLFLKANPDFLPLELLKEKHTVPQYLPYYEPDQLTIQCAHIADFYCAEKINSAKPRKFLYLTEHSQNEIIENMTGVIETDLAKKGILEPLKSIYAV